MTRAEHLGGEMNVSSFYGQQKGISRYRFLSSAIENVQSSSSQELDVVIIPPDNDQNPEISDEDEEDDLLDPDFRPNDVPGDVEVHDNEAECSDDEERAEGPHRWKKVDEVALGPHSTSPFSDEMLEHAGKEPIEIFDLFFTPGMVEHITMQTNLYASRDKNDKKFTIDQDEMRKFLGLLLISGYHKLPRENEYWSTGISRECPVFPKTMSRDRFKIIKRYLHVADNQSLSSSKVAKIEPIFDMLRVQCQQFGIFDELLSIDESMIPYRGNYSVRQYMHNKPIKFGYKMWMLCGNTGFPYNFSIYCGKDAERTGPLGAHVVNKMLSPVKDVSNHVVFFDNFFTSHQLISDLKGKGIRACGTVRDNRTGKCPLLSKKEIQKKARGTYDFRSDGEVLCVRWNDNCAVTVASNYFTVNPLHKAERRVRNESVKTVTQPHAVHMYNKGMGGVDVCDRKLAAYRPKLRNRKWWWNLFSHALNLALVAAYEFDRHINPGKKTDHYGFLVEVAETMVMRQVPRIRIGGTLAPVPRAVRYDGMNHHLVSCKQGRCVVCMKNTRLMCFKCDKRLHKAVCMDHYHKKP